jgi:hypothetical protein
LFKNFGAATAAKIPMITTTTTNSTNVNPFVFAFDNMKNSGDQETVFWMRVANSAFLNGQLWRRRTPPTEERFPSVET